MRELHASTLRLIVVLLTAGALAWGLYLLLYAGDLGRTSFWDGYCTTNDRGANVFALATGIAGLLAWAFIARRVWVAAEAMRFARGWLALAIALTLPVLWWIGVSRIHPAGGIHELPVAACAVD